MTDTAPSPRATIAVLGGLHAWPLLRAASDAIVAVPDSVAETARATEYVDPEYGPTVLGPVQLALDGALDEYSTVIFDRDHAMAHLYVAELRRRGLLRGMAPTYLFDIVVDDTTAVRRYDGAEVRGLHRHLERITRSTIELQRVADELAVERRLTEALGALQERRRTGGIDAVAAKRALADRRIGPVDDAIARIENVPAAQVSGPRVLLVPSLSSPGTELHELVRDTGGVVVEEDDWYGSRSIADAAETGDVLRDETDRLLATAATDRLAPMERRLAWFADQLDHVDVVVAITSPREARSGWDVPALRRAAEAAGRTFVWVHRALDTDSERQQVVDQLRAALAGARRAGVS